MESDVPRRTGSSNGGCLCTFVFWKGEFCVRHSSVWPIAGRERVVYVISLGFQRYVCWFFGVSAFGLRANGSPLIPPRLSRADRSHVTTGFVKPALRAWGEPWCLFVVSAVRSLLGIYLGAGGLNVSRGSGGGGGRAEESVQLL